MSFWVTELEQLEAILREVEREPQRMANLDQVARAIEYERTPDWGINEAVTTGLHRIYLIANREEFNRDHRGGMARRTENVLEALAQLGGPTAERYAVIVQKLSKAKKPITSDAFWDTYFDLLDEPSEFRVLPQTYRYVDMPPTWESVALLFEAGQVDGARWIRKQMQGKRDSGYPRPRNEREREAMRRSEGLIRRVAELTEEMHEYARVLDGAAIERNLRELDTIVIDSDVANTAKGILPELRRQRAMMLDSEQRSMYVDPQQIERKRRLVGYPLYGLAAFYGLVLFSDSGFAKSLFVLIGCAITFPALVAVFEARRNFWVWWALAFVGAIAGAALTLESVPAALVTAAITFGPLPYLYKLALDFNSWHEWNNLVHQANRLSAGGNGGGIHKVLAIEDALPWLVAVEPIRNTPEPFRNIRVPHEPEFSVGDYVVLTRGGEVAAHMDGERAELGLDKAEETLDQPAMGRMPEGGIR